MKIFTRFAILLTLAFTFTPRSRAADAWPLFEHTDHSTTVLYPFYVHEDDFVMFFPWYYRTNHGHDQHFLWPLVKLADNRPARIAPVWFRGKGGEYVLFPFIYESEDAIFWSVPPNYMRRDGSFKAVFPFWARDDTSWYAFPTTYHENTTYTTMTKVWPLYSNEVSKINGNKDFWLFPYASQQGKNWNKQAIFPLWTSGYDPRNPDINSLWLFPWYSSHDPHWNSQFVFPAFYHGSDPRNPDASNTTWLLAYYNRERPDSHRVTCFPLFGYNRSTHSNERTSNLNVLWPVYHRQVTRDTAGNKLAHDRRYLAFSDKLDREGHRTLSLFGFPIHERV